MESVFVEIDKDQVGKDRNVIAGVVYRPTDTDIDLFNWYMSEILDKIKSERKFVTCLGDCNISLLYTEMHEPTHEFTDLMYSYSMFPCITKPTRVTTKTAMLIVNIFCYDLITDNSGLAGMLYTDISDHFPVFYIDHSPSKKEKAKYFQKRLYAQTNIAKFKACVRDKNWSDVLSCNDPQSAYTAFYNDFTTMYDECFPLRTLKHGYKTREPWLSKGLKKSIQRKNKLFYRKNLRNLKISSVIKTIVMN